MSEIRRTTIIDEIDVPPREPLISLNEVITAVGWVAYHGTRLAVKGAIVGSVLAYRGGKALAAAAKESRKRSSSLSDVADVVNLSASAQNAVARLAEIPGIDLPQRQASAVSARLQSLVARNDKSGVAALARELMLAKQDRLQAQLMPLVAASCRAIGFAPKEQGSRYGSILAEKEGTRQSLAIEVTKAKDGGVEVYLDGDGFEGDACIEALDAFQAALRAHGVHCDLRDRKSKQRRPAFDQRRIGQRLAAYMRRS